MPARSRSKSQQKKKPTQAIKAEEHTGPHYEFGGPVGAFFTSALLPLVIYLLFFLCPSPKDGNKDGKAAKCFDVFDFANMSEQLEGIGSQYANVPNLAIEALFNSSSVVVFLAWMAFQIVLERFLPGDVANGAELSTGEKLKYRLNGHLAFWVSLLVVEHMHMGVDSFSLAFIYDNYIYLATASIIFSFLLSFYLYISSFMDDVSGPKLLAKGGHTGNTLYDWFIGRELNPRIGSGPVSFDLKCFCELRPGLIGWVVVNLGMLQKYKDTHNGKVSPELLLINLFQGLYVWDALYYERAILTTMDITTDGFGFMLAFGDLAWVPFTYSLQARFLVDHPPNLSTPHLLAICALKAVGYIVFRGSNGEKDAFRRDPNSEAVAHLETMNTKNRVTGKARKLLVSGWWGMARKINYTGDWLMGLAWCSLCGTDSIVPYFYSIYFFVLLVHRALRDDEACAEKYGGDWAKYKAKVRYIFIPGVV